MPTPNKNESIALLAASKRKPNFLLISVVINLIVFLLVVVVASAYWSSSSFLTGKLYKLDNNACAHYENHQKVKTTDVMKTVKGKRRAVEAFQLTQGQYTSGCYSYAINSNIFAYAQLAQLPVTQAMPIFFGPNGQNLEGIPGLSVAPINQ